MNQFQLACAEEGLLTPHDFLPQGPQLGVIVPLLVALSQSSSQHLKLKAGSPWWFITLEIYTHSEVISIELDCLLCHKLQEDWEEMDSVWVIMERITNSDAFLPRHIPICIWFQFSIGEISLSRINMPVKISRVWGWEDQLFIKQMLFSPWVQYQFRNVLYFISWIFNVLWSFNTSYKSLPPPLVSLSTT